MTYALLAITLLTLIIIVVLFWAHMSDAKVLYQNIKKNRDINQTKYAQIDQLMRECQNAIQLITITQDNLDKKMNALSQFVDERNTYVTFQQEQFKDLAKADMLTARRDELIRTKELKIALERIISMTTMSRQAPAAIDQLAIESLTRRIKELEDILKT